MKDNPSLKGKLDEAFAEAYELAVIGAARETGQPEADFPQSAPYRFEQTKAWVQKRSKSALAHGPPAASGACLVAALPVHSC